MKRIYLFIAFIGSLAGIYYLYQWQLGAIAFFLLSIFFFRLSYKQYSKKEEQKVKGEQDEN